MDSTKLLQDIAHTLIGLAPSPIHGIGVFALADIAANTSDLFSPGGDDWPAIPLAMADTLPPHARKLIATYCLSDEEKIYLPPHGFKLIEPAMYLNHSDEPNLKQMEGGNYFVTLRDIKAGEELFIDYNTLTTDQAAHED